MIHRLAFALIGVIGATCIARAQDVDAIRLELERLDQFKFDTANRVSAFRGQDISLFFAPRTPFLGFRGETYERLRVYFHRIARDAADPLLYRVRGRTDVAGRVRTFQGTIRIVQVLAVPREYWGVDNVHGDKGFRLNAFSLGEYEFQEDSTTAGWGVYSGAAAVSWIQDRRGILHRDDFLNEERDGMKNNLFLGVWRARGADSPVRTSWGERRMLASGDLDIGAAYFGVNPKYVSRGWQDIDQRTDALTRVP